MFSKDFLNEEATYELKNIVGIEMKNKLNGANLICKTRNKEKDKAYDFEKFKIIKDLWKRNL